jgi:hypothetical protein
MSQVVDEIEDSGLTEGINVDVGAGPSAVTTPVAARKPAVIAAACAAVNPNVAAPLVVLSDETRLAAGTQFPNESATTYPAAQPAELPIAP